MARNDRLGCAVIGVGWMGQRHARVWSELPYTALRSVYDVDRERAERVAEDLKCDVAASVDELVSRDDVHIVSICTPDNMHLEPCIAAAQAGKHLMIEKPLATTVPDARTIMQAVEQAGVKAMVGHIVRFDPRYSMAREQVRAGALGDLVYIYARRYNIIDSGERIAPRSTVTFFLGIHDIDAIHWVTGRRITAVYARSASKLLADRASDDACVSILEFDNGACGCLETLWVNPRGVVSTLDARLELTGTQGRISLRIADDDLQVAGEQRTQALDITYGPEVMGRLGGALRIELAHFARCVLEDDVPAVSMQDALRAVVVAQAIEQSLTVGERVEVF